ncbi:MAG: PGDYG domain-containing protein [Pseudomonadota bacterium]
MFKSSGKPGYTNEIGGNPRRVVARKLEREVQVHFATAPRTVQTNEGLVQARTGDAILTGINGEHWRVSQARFGDKYRPAEATTAGTDGAYISLPNRVFAVPMKETFEVLLADGDSKLTGRAGDWLVDYGDGSLGVVSSKVFDQTYEVVG